jgi:hypothetical protein
MFGQQIGQFSRCGAQNSPARLPFIKFVPVPLLKLTK